MSATDKIRTRLAVRNARHRTDNGRAKMATRKGVLHPARPHQSRWPMGRCFAWWTTSKSSRTPATPRKAMVKHRASKRQSCPDVANRRGNIASLIVKAPRVKARKKGDRENELSYNLNAGFCSGRVDRTRPLRPTTASIARPAVSDKYLEKPTACSSRHLRTRRHHCFTLLELGRWRDASTQRAGQCQQRHRSTGRPGPKNPGTNLNEVAR